MSTIPIIASIFSILSYLRPEKSPYLLITAVGVFCLNISIRAIDGPIWVAVIFPIIFVLLYATVLSIRSKERFEIEDYKKQILISRSLSLSSVFILLVVSASTDILGENPFFWFIYFPSLIQIILFLFMDTLFRKYSESLALGNLIQLGLITSVLLCGGASGLIVDRDNLTSLVLRSENSISLNTAALLCKGAIIYYVLIVLWIYCLSRWWRIIKQMIKIRIVPPEINN